MRAQTHTGPIAIITLKRVQIFCEQHSKPFMHQPVCIHNVCVVCVCSGYAPRLVIFAVDTQMPCVCVYALSSPICCYLVSMIPNHTTHLTQSSAGSDAHLAICLCILIAYQIVPTPPNVCGLRTQIPTCANGFNLGFNDFIGIICPLVMYIPNHFGR